MIEKLRQRSQSEAGFTLVELLVVMLIIGLLAAIAIPSFFNQRDKARDAEAKTTARTAQTAMETYATDNNGNYTGATEALLAQIEETLTDADAAAALDVPATGARDYVINVTSDTGTVFTITRAAGGNITLTCDQGGEGGCPNGGTWD